MTTEDKLLLVQDLCARLPYGVKVEDTRCGIIGRLRDMTVIPLYKGNDAYNYLSTTNFYHDCYYDDIDLFKPYLFPLSSMTEEIEDEIYSNTGIYDIDVDSSVSIEVGTTFEDLTKISDILHKYHIDYRNLIQKGLAIDATGLNIY